jgi:hypothetical protein
MFWFFQQFGRLRILFFLLMGLFFLPSAEQELLAQVPTFRFLSDSVQVGEHVQASYSFRHAPNQEIIFPDSNYKFSPFEFVSKTYFPTSTVDGESVDSAIYTLSIFEIEGTHALTLPVMVFKGKDTLKLFSNIDSVTVKPFITVVSDTLKLQSNTEPMALERHFNYLILLIIVVVFLVLAVVAFLVFGKNILEQIKRYRRKIAHQRFLKQYDAIVVDVTSLLPQKMEEAVSLWKKYIESLENKPYTTFTSSEIGYYLKNESIKKNLQNIDIAIYSGRGAGVASQDFSALREVAVNLYIRSQTAPKK